jgi:hypothetical protein
MHNIMRDMRDMKEVKTDGARSEARPAGAATQSPASMQGITGWRPNNGVAGTGLANVNLNSQIGWSGSIRGRGAGRGGLGVVNYKGPRIGRSVGNDVIRVQEGDKRRMGVYCFRCRIWPQTVRIKHIVQYAGRRGSILQDPVNCAGIMPKIVAARVLCSSDNQRRGIRGNKSEQTRRNLKNLPLGEDPQDMWSSGEDHCGGPRRGNRRKGNSPGK